MATSLAKNTTDKQYLDNTNFSVINELWLGQWKKKQHTHFFIIFNIIEILPGTHL